MSRKEIPLEEQFSNDPATVEWLKAQKKSSQQTYKSYWSWFLEYAEEKYGLKTGAEILEDRKQNKAHKWEQELMKFREWSLRHTCEVHKKPLSENGAKTACGAVRGFFAFHYQDLKLRRNDSAKIKKTKRVTQDYKLSKEDIARMSVVGNIRDRYILVVGKSLGLRAGDFIRLKIGDFTCLDLEQPAPIPMGRIDTTKEGVPAFPFLDRDAVEVVKAYLETLDISDPNKRMLNIKQHELSAILRRLAKKAKINLGNKNLRFHCLRKFLIDRLSAVMSESKWKQIVGKQIDEEAYVSEAQLREAYAKAMPETTFSNYNHAVMTTAELENRISELEEFIKTTLTMMAEELKRRYDIDLKEFMKQISA